MATSIPKPRNRYKVAEAKQQMADKIGSAEVEIELSDGSVVSFPHPMFYDSALKRELRKFDEDDSEGVALTLLGEDQYQRFVDDGNDADDLKFVMAQVQNDTEDRLAGRKRPTQS